MREAFISKRFSEASLSVIESANDIIVEYRAMGFTLTLRQLYYQFVSRDLIANKQSEYKRIGSIINDGRLAGLIDWSAIEDRTRNVETTSTWESPDQIVEAVADQYRQDLWASQTSRPEVWIEKEALIGVIEPVCRRFGVPYFACRGYSSQSEQYAAGKRFKRYLASGLTPVVLHLGDHDPSGLDMTRDNTDRLAMFAGTDVTVVRLALNWDQIERYSPPPNPAKDTDARFERYRDEFGNESWELDALDPRTIEALISDEIEGLIDREEWEEAERAQEEAKDLLLRASQNWDQVRDFLETV